MFMENFRKYLLEGIGTAVLIFCACGVSIMTGGDLVGTSLAFGLTMMMLAFFIGHITGCHLNPAVSLAYFIARKMKIKDFGFYVAFQFAGAFTGALLLYAILRISDMNIIVDASNYVVNYFLKGDAAFTAGNVFCTILIESALTLLFVFTVLFVNSKHFALGKFAPIFVGIALLVVHLIGLYLTGTSVNPARSLATALNNAIFFQQTEALTQVWIFLLVPSGAGAVAGVIYNLLFKEHKQEADA